MKTFFRAVDAFFSNRRNLFLFGLVLTLLLSFSEVMRGKHFNFMIFSGATHDFWNGLIPYAQTYHDTFLYGPVFNVLFAPFAYLPAWLGPFAWNVFNFTLYFFAIYALPDRFTQRQKRNTYLYTMLILATTQLSFQYNVAVAYLFLFAYILLEQGRGGWAVMLILLSGFTKVYGIFELGLLLCYPHFWRNMGYVVLGSVFFFLLPLVNLPLEGLLPYYHSWIEAVTLHGETRSFETFFDIGLLFDQVPPYAYYVQAGILVALAVALLANRRKYGEPAFRVQALGVLMGYVILFGTSSEKHTYVIALLGFLLWYWSRRPDLIDRVLFWANFIVLVVMPVDVLCPVGVMKFCYYTLDLNLWIFLVTWLRMVQVTFILHEPASARWVAGCYVEEPSSEPATTK